MKKMGDIFGKIKQKLLNFLPESFFEREKVLKKSVSGKIKNIFSKKQNQEFIETGRRRLKKTVKIFFKMVAVLFFMGIVSYFVILYFASDIETTITFPGKDINLKEIVQHPAGLIVAKDIFLTTPEGDTIHGIYIDNKAEKTVYYFHGNGAPMQHFFTEMRYISDLGYNLIAYDYPGYGKSTGKPRLHTIRQFSDTFFDYIKREYDLKDADTIIWGYSIGTALAVDFGKNRDFNALVLVSPLASRYAMSEKIFGFPIQKLFFLPNGLISSESIKTIDEPTFIVHGNKDIVVPIEQGRLVYENSPAQKKRFIEVDDFGHSLIIETYGDVLQDYIQNFLGDDVALPSNTGKNTGLRLGNDQKLSPDAQSQELQDKIFLNRKIATAVLKEQQRIKRIISLDIASDDSYTKYVGQNVSFESLEYIPQDLQKINSPYVRDMKGDLQLRLKAGESFEQLAEAFFSNFGETIDVVSSYRSYTYQAGIKDRGCPDELCAKAGYSEHQSGLAIDLWEATTLTDWRQSEKLKSYYNWLAQNAHVFGWHNPYQNGEQLDGYEPEPWHWRYVGVELATYLKQQNVTFPEYYKARLRAL